MFFFENYFVAILGDSSQLIAASSFYLSSPRRPFACLVSRGLFACLVPLMTYSTYPIKLPSIDRAVGDLFFLEANPHRCGLSLWNFGRSPFSFLVGILYSSAASDVYKRQQLWWKQIVLREKMSHQLPDQYMTT